MSEASILVENGKYLINNGQLVNANSLFTEIYFCLITERGTYLLDKNVGSDLLPYLRSGTFISRTELTSIILEGLAPMIQNSRIKPNPQIIITLLISNKVSFTINAIDNVGAPIEFKWQNYGN